MCVVEDEELGVHLVSRIGGAERLCHLRQAGAGEDDGHLKQGGAWPPGNSNWWSREAVPPEKGGI